MDLLLIFFTVAACLVAAARIAVLSSKAKRRKKERLEAEAAGRIIFHEEIDDLCLMDEIKKSGAIIFGIVVCPAAMINVWYCSYAGPFSKAMTLISVIAGFVYTIRAIENRQA